MVDAVRNYRSEDERRTSIEEQAKKFFEAEQERRDLRDRLYPHWKTSGPEDRRAIEERIHDIIRSRRLN